MTHEIHCRKIGDTSLDSKHKDYSNHYDMLVGKHSLSHLEDIPSIPDDKRPHIEVFGSADDETEHIF